MNTVKIKRKHIEQGIPDNICNCPVALAIKDQTELDVQVTGHYLYVRKTISDEIYEGYAVNRKFFNFISEYDSLRFVALSERQARIEELSDRYAGCKLVINHTDKFVEWISK